MEKQTAILSTQLRHLLTESKVSILTSMVIASILAYVQLGVIATPVVVSWFLFVLLVSVFRLTLVFAYQRTEAGDDATVRSRLVKMRWGVLLAGVTWGSAGFFMYPASDPQHQMFLIFMLAGLTAGGVVSNSADLISAACFAVAALAPTILRMFVDESGLSVAMGMAAGLYLGFMLFVLRHINKSITRNIVLHLEAIEREAAIKASEERYRLLLTHLPVGVFHYDKDLLITYCNARFAQILNSSEERLVGLDMKLLKDASIVPAIFKALKGETGHYEGPYQATFSDAGGWMDLTCSPSRDERGNIEGGIGIVQDFTERKQIEDALAENQEKYRGLSEAAFEAIFISEKGKCLEQNTRAREMFGYSDQEAVGRSGTEWIVPQDREMVARHMLSGYESPYEAAGLRKDGTSFPAIIHGRTMHFKGRAVRVTSMRDISDKKLAEAALQQQLRYASALNAIAKRVVVQDDPLLILEDVIHVISETLATDRALIYDISFSKQQAIGLCEWLNPAHPGIAPTKAIYPLELFIGGASEIRRTQQFLSSRQDKVNPFLLADGSGDILHKQMQIRSLLWYPFAFREDGYFLLALNELYADRDWSPEELAFLDSASQLVSVALEKIRLMDEGNHLAFYDPLTQLPNRRLLIDRLQQALASSSRSGKKGSLLFLDLDHFKTINDTLGHHIGDLMLQQAAQRLASCVREGDTVARLGGDEFVVMLEDLSQDALESAEQTEAVGEKILAALSQPYRLAEHECRITPSIGATLFTGHQQNVDELLKQADIAMYQSKKSGRNTLRFFDPDMQNTINTRAAMEADLRAALDKQQFQLHYQVQVNTQNRALGAEALIRWAHPELGMVPPMQFIPLAEETGLILPIGAWVLRSACAQLKSWQQDALTRDLTLAVNVSAKQFHQPDFVAQVRQILLESGAKPAHLKLELTESMMLENVDEIIAKMGELKLLGIHFSLDDFGTGYSSLQYIKRLPLDQLKIDRSFVRDISTDINDAAIVQTIVAMSQALGLDVIAEGVETEVQRDFLDKHGCHTFQGFMFGKPVPAEQFATLLKQL